LIVADTLRLAAEVGAPDLGNDRLKPLVTSRQLITLGDNRVALGNDHVALGDNRSMVARAVAIRTRSIITATILSAEPQCSSIPDETHRHGC
jgi:hypothetical protein